MTNAAQEQKAEVLPGQTLKIVPVLAVAGASGGVAQQCHMYASAICAKGDGKVMVARCHTGWFNSPVFCGGFEVYNTTDYATSHKIGGNFGWTIAPFGSIFSDRTAEDPRKAFPQAFEVPEVEAADVPELLRVVYNSVACAVLMYAQNGGQNCIIGRDKSGGHVEKLMQHMAEISKLPKIPPVQVYQGGYAAHSDYGYEYTALPWPRELTKVPTYNVNSSNLCHIFVLTAPREKAQGLRDSRWSFKVTPFDTTPEQKALRAAMCRAAGVQSR